MWHPDGVRMITGNPFVLPTWHPDGVRRIQSLSRKNRHGMGAGATAQNRGSARPKAGLSGLRLRAGRGVQRSVCLRNEGTPRLEAHPLREAVRWADVLGLDFLVTFGSSQK